MKILQIIKGIKNDLSSSTMRMKNATGKGYTIANRTANIYKQNKIHKYYNVTKSVSSKIIQNTNRNDIPYAAGGLGMLIPVPFLSAILMGLGFATKYLLNKHNNKNSSI